MELDGLLLDEEGTFSLSGFQEFTVSRPCFPPAPGAPLVVPGVAGAACPQPRTSAGPWGVAPLVPGPEDPRVTAHPGPWPNSWGPRRARCTPKLGWGGEPGTGSARGVSHVPPCLPAVPAQAPAAERESAEASLLWLGQRLQPG